MKTEKMMNISKDSRPLSQLDIMRWLSVLFMAHYCCHTFPQISAQNLSKTEARNMASQEIFAGSKVLRIEIEIPEEGIQELGTYRFQFRAGSDQPRPKARAIVREGGREYRDVSVHLKGAAGSFRPVDDKPAMTLNFDKHVDGQEFYGLDKIYLNNSVQDGSYLSEKVSRELYQAAGIPTPRAGHAIVTLNGRVLGMYVLVEGFNKRFLKRHFNDISGNLYDGGFVQDIDHTLNTNSGENPEDQSDREALLAACREEDLGRRLERLSELLDLEKFYAQLALDAIACNWDGYAQNRNNFRLYHDMDSGKFIFIPHGMDQMFQSVEAPVFMMYQSIVAKALFEILESGDTFLQALKKIYGTVYQGEKVAARVDAISAYLQPALGELGDQAVAMHNKSAAQFRDHVLRRTRFVQENMEALENPLAFDDDGEVVLTQWETEEGWAFPVSLRSEKDDRSTLMMGTEKGESVAAWRSRVWLPKGSYRFEGVVRLEDVRTGPGDASGGVAMYARGLSFPERSLGSTDWMPLQTEFNVGTLFSQVDLICEYRAAQGSAWFDADTLKLVKVE